MSPSRTNCPSGKHIPVEEVSRVAIFAEVSVFSVLFIAFLVGRFECGSSYLEFATGAQSLNQEVGLANAFILMAGSTVVLTTVLCTFGILYASHL